MKIKLLPLLFICFILIQSCEKPDPNGCHNAVIFYNYLSDAARNQTPYFTNPAFDTISFASDKGDTLIFVKTKTDSTWYKEEIRGNPACDWDKEYYQVLHNKYTTLKGNGSFDVKLSKKTKDGSLNAININFNDIDFDIDLGWLNPSFGYSYFIGLSVINNRNYINTIYAYNILGDTSSSYIIINKDNGLLKLNNKNDNTVWTLLKP
jgi:hypothetical protein